MNLLHLKYALEVAKTGSISQAAENLFMGQPNLSRIIREMEESLGIALFERTPKGVVPTRLSESFFAYAKSIVDQVEELESIYRTPQEETQILRLTMPCAAYLAMSAASTAAQMDVTREILVRIEEATNQQVIQNTYMSGHQLGILRILKSSRQYYEAQLSERDLCFQALCTFKPLLLMSANHPLATQRHIMLADLTECVEVLFGDEDSAVESVLREERTRRIYVSGRGAHVDFLSRVPKAFMWVSPAPSEVLQRYGFVQRVCGDVAEEYCDLVIYKRGHLFSEVERLFLKELDKMRDNVLNMRVV